jgi:hypothetical protein
MLAGKNKFHREADVLPFARVDTAFNRGCHRVGRSPSKLSPRCPRSSATFRETDAGGLGR